MSKKKKQNKCNVKKSAAKKIKGEKKYKDTWQKFLLRGKQYFEQKSSGIPFYLIITIISFVLMIAFSACESLWDDELYSVLVSAGHSLLKATTMDKGSPPLFPVLSFFWYKIAPYGEHWLLLPNEFFAAVSVFMTGMVGEKIGGRKTGIMAAVFIAFNYAVFKQCAYEYRNYALLLMLSTLMLYFFVERLQNGSHSKRNQVAFGLCMALAAYTHYFGIVLCFVLFLIDLVLWLTRKTKLSFIVPYLCAGISYIPWFIFYFYSYGTSGSGIALLTPNLKSICELLYFVCGHNMVILCAFIVSAALILIKSLVDIIRKKADVRNTFLSCLFLLIDLIMITAIYVYSTKIQFVSSLWFNRYFVGLIPCTMLVCAQGIRIVYDAIAVMLPKRKNVIAFILFLALIAFYPQSFYRYFSADMKQSDFPYREAAEYLYTQSDALKSDTLLITEGHEGWQEYYLTKQGRRPSINFSTVSNVKKQGVKYMDKYNTVYYCYLFIGYSYINGDISNYLKQNFTIANDQTAVGVLKYIRIKQKA